jgi:hypothetical protein
MTRAALLLADPSPCLRRLVLRDLLNLSPQDTELGELEALCLDDPLVANLLARQQADGSWLPQDLGAGHPFYATSVALERLGYLGLSQHPQVQPVIHRAAEYLFARQQPDGSWPLSKEAEMTDGGGEQTPGEGYSMVPLQTALPLRGLAACGYSSDRRAAQAYQWLLERQLPDGAWPTGIAGGPEGVFGYVAGYRRLAHSRWGCRSNTTGALICLAQHPDYRLRPEARRALDLLLGRETREREPLGFETARVLGAEAARGFFTYFARFDLALLLDLCGRMEISTEDGRVAGLVKHVLSLKGTYGLWEYLPKPQISRWLTFDLLRSLARLQSGVWIGSEPQTPFQPYPKKSKRF